DFNRPSSERVALPVGQRPCSPTDADCLPVLDGQYDFAMAFRPTGRRDVDASFDLQYWQGANLWTPRGVLGVDIPSFGRAFASVEVVHLENDHSRGVLGTAGLELHWGGASVGGGALFGNGLGAAGNAAGYATVAFSGYAQPGIPTPERAVWIRLEETPGTR